MRIMRAGLLFLATGQLVTGGWALSAPAHFYDTFPGFRPGWVAADGPFNHHLITDVGAGFLATGVALLLAAAWVRREVVLVALVTYLAHALPHLAYHVRHPAAALPVLDRTLSWAALAGGVVVASALLAAAAAGRDRRRLPGPAVAGADRRRLRGAVAGPDRRRLRGAVAGADRRRLRGATATADSRLAPLHGRPRNPLLVFAFAAARRRLGAVPVSWRVLARVPRVALARIVGDAAFERTRIVPARVGALVMLRAATMVQCAFCTDILSAVAARHGVRADQVRDLARWRDSTAFDEQERLALTLADALTATPGQVPDDLLAALVGCFGEAGVVELATAIGHENARARANRALGVGPQGFAAAAACPVPEVVGS